MKGTINSEVVQPTLKRGVIMMTLMLGSFLALLNETILNVAFSTLMTEMNITAGTVQWLATGYMLVIGISIPVTAFLIHTYTTRKLFMVAMGFFLAGTLIAGFSSTFLGLLVARIIQGCGTGMLVPIMMNAILLIYPIEKQGTAMGKAIFVILFAPAIGPTFSGVVLQYLNWNWLFFSLVPFSLLAIALGVVYLKLESPITKPKFDFLSVLLSTIGFGGIILGISLSESNGFKNNSVIISIVVGILSLLVYSKRQLILSHPMLDIRVLKNPMFLLGTLLVMINLMMLFSINLVLPLFLQKALLLSSFAAGLFLLPGGLINGIVSLFSGRIYDRFGARVLAIPGFLVMVVSVGLLAGVTVDTPLIWIVVLQCCVSIASALIMTPVQMNSLSHLDPEQSAHGVAILNTLQQIACAVGSSLFLGLLGTGQKLYMAQLSETNALSEQNGFAYGLHYSLIVATVILAITFLLSFFIKRREADASTTIEQVIESAE
ncbi:MAG: multidrug efflux MFS transporter [Bacteroidales bacterium]|nr:multidrug efflux MFS transporter [Bacteroidales bacterium]HRX31709.1 MDR family MFS transporter [Tenuifilaceae bacterium]